jgi:hypothetical protein
MADETVSVHAGLILDELMRARDENEGLSRAQLQEKLGIGAGDLSAALDSLRETGHAAEEAPDEWWFVVEETEVAPGEPPAASNGGLPSLAEAEAASRGEPPPAAPARARPEDRETVLTTAMVESLEDAALGALVKAGVAGAGSFAFVLRIEA